MTRPRPLLVAAWLLLVPLPAHADEAVMPAPAAARPASFRPFQRVQLQLGHFGSPETDCRGDRIGAMAIWADPAWAMRASTFLLSEAGNAASPQPQGGSHQLELEIHPIPDSPETPLTLRVRGFTTWTTSGNDGDTAYGLTPDPLPDRPTFLTTGNTQVGGGISFDQAVADSGLTGLYGGVGWQGTVRSTGTEMATGLSALLGAHVSGRHWWRPLDRLGVAVALRGQTGGAGDSGQTEGLATLPGSSRSDFAGDAEVAVSYAAHIWGPLSVSVEYRLTASSAAVQDRETMQAIALRTQWEP